MDRENGMAKQICPVGWWRRRRRRCDTFVWMNPYKYVTAQHKVICWFWLFEVVKHAKFTVTTVQQWLRNYIPIKIDWLTAPCGFALDVTTKRFRYRLTFNPTFYLFSWFILVNILWFCYWLKDDFMCHNPVKCYDYYYLWNIILLFNAWQQSHFVHFFSIFIVNESNTRHLSAHKSCLIRYIHSAQQHAHTHTPIWLIIFVPSHLHVHSSLIYCFFFFSFEWSAWSVCARQMQKIVEKSDKFKLRHTSLVYSLLSLLYTRNVEMSGYHNYYYYSLHANGQFWITLHYFFFYFYFSSVSSKIHTLTHQVTEVLLATIQSRSECIQSRLSFKLSNFMENYNDFCWLIGNVFVYAVVSHNTTTCWMASAQTLNSIWLASFNIFKYLHNVKA